MGALSRLRQGFGAPGLRRAIGIAATLLLLTLLSWPALAAGRPQSRLDATLATRAGQPGVSRVIVRSTGATDVTAKIRAHRGQAGQRLALVNGYVAEVPNDALEALAAADGVAGRASGPACRRAVGAGCRQRRRQRQGRFIERARLHWRWRRCRGDRLGAHFLARRPGARRRRAARWSASASWALPISRARPARSPTATVTARTSPESSRDRVTTATASSRAWRRVRICWC